MNSIEKINSITKLSDTAIDNLNLDIFNNINNAVKVAAPVLNVINHDIYKNINNVAKASLQMIEFINSDTYKNIYDAMKTSLYSIINSDFYNNLNSVIKQASLQMIEFINSDTYKNIYDAVHYATSILNVVTTDVYKNINFDVINAIKSSIEQTVNEISEKDEYDDNDVEKVAGLSKCALEITLTNNYPKSVKKNILINIYKNMWKLMGVPQFALILTVVLFTIQNIISNNTSQRIIIKETIREIIIIEKESRDLNLRGIINNDTRLYKKPNTKSIIIFTLDCGDIIEVIEIHKKWAYVRLYKTDIEGWVLKKYTKGSKIKKTNNLNII